MCTTDDNDVSIVRFRDSHFTADDIRRFLERMDKDHLPPVSLSVDFAQYVIKLNRLAEILLAVHHDTIVAMLAFYCNDFTIGLSRMTYLGVLREYRRRGIGVQLMKTCIHMARSAGMKNLVTRTAQKNEASTGFYTKHGFHRMRETADRPDGSISAWFELRF